MINLFGTMLLVGMMKRLVKNVGVDDIDDVIEKIKKLEGKPLSEMTNEELALLGYKRHNDGSIRDALGHFVGDSGIVPGTPTVDIVEQYLSNNGYKISGREISVRSADGTLRRYDIVAISPDGVVIGIEVKGGSAIRTAQQIRIDNELINSGGLNTVGQNAVDAGVSHIDSVNVFTVDEFGNIVKK